jgi:hypothetical protein
MTSTVLYQIRLTPINAHVFIYILNVQQKLTKFNVLIVKLVTFACYLKKLPEKQIEIPLGEALESFVWI